MPLDTPKSYFEYRNRSISKVYAFFKTRTQGNAILKPTCLHFGTLNGWKRSSKGFPRVSWRPSIFDHFFSCFKMCLERPTWRPEGAPTAPEGGQEALRRGGGTAQKSTQERKPTQDASDTPKRCCLTPSGDHFSIILGFYFGYFAFSPNAFCGVMFSLWKHVGTIFLDSFHTSL